MIQENTFRTVSVNQRLKNQLLYFHKSLMRECFKTFYFQPLRLWRLFYNYINRHLESQNQDQRTSNRIIVRQQKVKESEVIFLTQVIPVDSFSSAKGQLISKFLFVVFHFLQKTNQNKFHNGKIEFIRSFFRGNVGLKKSF